MFRRMRPWKALLVVAMLALATTITAQQRIAPPMSAQRSYAVQAQLQAIDADRAAWVNQFLAQWSPYVDGSAYDIYEELTPVLMKAPAWQLYGASLVGDFNTMLGILTGGRGAGPYINSLSAPEPKVPIGPTWSSFAPPSSNQLGSGTESLVFTPIAPCRIVDTRGTGARTGLIAAETSRSFDLTTSGYTSGQGGATSGCTGLPSFSYTAWAVNVTATGYSSTGGLKAWPYLGTEPNASIINYSALIYPAIANGQDLTGCYACADDIVIKAFTAPTHVIIDVVGYFREAAGTAATVSRVAGTPFSTASTAFFAVSGACPAGTVLIGGEMDHDNIDLAIGESRQHAVNPTAWTFFMINNTGGTVAGTPYSRCMDQPIQIP